MESQLKVVTAFGEFSVRLDHDAAPKTCGYFHRLAELGALDNTTVYRIVSPENGVHQAAHPIAVLQGGLRQEDDQPLPGIEHESTAQSGLRHRQWVVSTARFAPGETYGSFFVCLRDEPALDYGGKRHPDGVGFAAFGEVVAGFDVVEALYEQRTDTEMLAEPVPIKRVVPLSGAV